MKLFFALLFTVIFISACCSLFSRLKNPIFNDKKIKEIKHNNKYVVGFGLSGSVSSWIFYYLWEYKILSCPFIVFLFLGLFSLVSFCITTIVWLFTPSSSSIKYMANYEENKKKLNSFLNQYSVDKKYKVNDIVVAVCQYDKMLLIYDDISPVHNVLNYRAIPFNSIIECEIIEDNSTIMKGGLGRAVAGAAIAGATGAIVGAATRKSTDVINNLSIRIIANEVLNPYYNVEIISETMDRKSEKYKQLFQETQKIYASVIAIINNK